MRLLRRVGIGLAVALVAAVPARSEAAVITWQLNCVIAGGAVCTDSSSLGTVTLTDGAVGTVTGVLDYSGNGVLKDSVYLNFNPTLDNTGWNVTGAKLDSFLADENNIKADGYNGDFDLRILFQNSQFEPYAFTITRTGLTTADFLFRDDDNTQLFVAAHIQSGVTSTGADCSIWMGSKGTGTPTGPAPPCGPGGGGGGGGGGGQTIPEPTSLALFGLAALGAARARRRS
jgi:hypothetical protein